MTFATESLKANDPGLAALVMLLRFQGVAADPEQIRHRLGGVIGVPEMLRCAKEFDLRARSTKTTWKRLANTPLPGIAPLRDGGGVFAHGHHRPVQKGLLAMDVIPHRKMLVISYAIIGAHLRPRKTALACSNTHRMATRCRASMRFLGLHNGTFQCIIQS